MYRDWYVRAVRKIHFGIRIFGIIFARIFVSDRSSRVIYLLLTTLYLNFDLPLLYKYIENLNDILMNKIIVKAS